ncbi:MAG: hypothetical protein ED556_11995 [Winogradskyella sp.]|uniref:hypothetical protein n=1 Tax=Winogradskyella sp. TaxID=1883156 RepID=UPI000F3CB014|nr:hypothetical protein [Winogradskyella sp.]RNC84172.1 MAG: hypothetical protein ED556_11995 [Winogradskyella sp.]
MAPIKFEEQIKDKLEKRTVSPSTNAWSKLSHRLDADEKSKKRTAFWWFGIAASIAALVFLSILYFDKSNNEPINNTLVEDKNEVITTPENDVNTINEEVNATQEDAVAISEEIKTDKSIEEVEDSKLNNTSKKAYKVLLPSKRNTDAVASLEEKSSPANTDEVINNSSRDVINTPEIEIKDIITELDKIKSQKEYAVSDKDIDSLLKIANRELLMDKQIKKRNTIVDADALLQDVEDEMGQSFRTLIYETLKDGYKRVKTVVAKRNDQ